MDTRFSSHPRPGRRPILRNLGSGLETHGTSELPDPLESVATSLQRLECDRGRRSFAKAGHGHVFHTTSATEPENDAFSKGRVRGTSSVASACAERIFVKWAWWASQRQSNGGILEVHSPKINQLPDATRAVGDAQELMP